MQLFCIGLQVLESILLTDPEKIVASRDCIGCLEKVPFNGDNITEP